MLWCDIARVVMLTTSSSLQITSLVIPVKVATTSTSTSGIIIIVPPEAATTSLKVVVLGVLVVRGPGRTTLIRRRLCIIVVLTLRPRLRGESSLLLMILRVLTEHSLIIYPHFRKQATYG